MDTQTSYKRTVAGSVGAGMGAIFNGSGRTYYMLEHKTSSKFHQAGETQKIIIDQVELGRDASCQVRFDESFDTVSRKHAAIERDGDNWKLVHLSSSNPTLVNGRPIQDSYYLQSGDEIQLSVNGPRLGFIVPQGKQALTSSIKLTERMNLFRQQALRPYRRAIWVLGSLLVLAILGFGAWNYSLTKDNQALKAEMATYQAQMDSLSLEKERLDNLEQQIQEKLAADPENAELKQQLADLAEQKTRVVHHYNTVYRAYTDTQNKIEGNEVAKNEKEDEGVLDDAMDQDAEEAPAPAPDANEASDNIETYYNDIYTLKVDRITIEYAGRTFEPSDITKSDVIVGTAFVLPGGQLVTSRFNLEPWLFGKEGGWREKLNRCMSLPGVKIVIDYLAYSTRGTGYPLRFKNTDFNLEALHTHDVLEPITEIKEYVKTWNFYGFEVSKKEVKANTYTRRVITAESNCAGVLSMGAPGGLPKDDATAQSLKGGEEVVITGFNNNPNVHDLTSFIKYFTSRTSRNAQFRLITLQDSYSNIGYTGSPVFFKESDGSYKVVGVNVGNYNGETFVARITDLKR